MNDKEIRDRMESLSALDTGYVYGADEAWDRLDNRLQQSQKKRVFVIGIRWAAAAILLILVAAGIYIYSPQNAGTQPIALQQQEKEVLPVVGIADTPASMAIQESLPATKKHLKRTTVKKITCYAEPELQLIDPPTPAPPPAQPERNVVHTPSMAIVHINELGKSEVAEEAPVVWNGPALDIKKMKIVTLQEINITNYSIPAKDEAIVYRLTRNSGTINLMRGFYSEGNTPLANQTLSVRFGKRN